MHPYNVRAKLLCVEGWGPLKEGDYYTVKEVFDIASGYTYELEELPDEYWNHNRFVEVEQ